MKPASQPSAVRRKACRLTLAVETLEERIALSWGSIPPAVITPPGSYTPVQLDANADAAGSGEISLGEVDWYKFTANTGGPYYLEATTPGSNLDTVIGVYNASGIRVGYNNNINPTNTDSRFGAILSAGQVYYFGVTNYSRSGFGTYAWRIDGATGGGGGDDQYEENDSLAAARDLGALSSSQTYSGLVMADNADFFKFTMSAAGVAGNAVSIAFTNSQGNLDLKLFTSAGTQVGSSAGTGNGESISLAGLAAGTYTVQVYGVQGAQNPGYSLTINPGGGGGGGFQITLNISGMTTSQRNIFQQAAARWAQVITGDLPNASYNGVLVDDVLIDASSVPIDGVGGILGQAGPDRFRTGTYLPYHGRMQFDTADLANLEASGGLLYVILHEMGHVLGIGTIWTYRGLLSGGGTTNPRFTGVHATAEYNAIFGASATGVPVENTGGGGTRDSHWRESVFRAELMTGWLNSGANPMSRVTVASMWDLGYTVNMAAADSYTPPGGTPSGPTGGGGGGGAALRAAFGPNLRRPAASSRFGDMTSPFLPSDMRDTDATIRRAADRLLAHDGRLARRGSGARPFVQPEDSVETLYVDEFSALFGDAKPL